MISQIKQIKTQLSVYLLTFMSRNCQSGSDTLLCCLLSFQMMKHAWDSYRQYGWGHNELKPLAKKGHSTNIFGKPDKARSPTAVCAHWQFAHTVVNHTWMHARMRTHSASLTVKTRVHTHSHTNDPVFFSCGQGYVIMPPAGCISLWGECLQTEAWDHAALKRQIKEDKNMYLKHC